MVSLSKNIGLHVLVEQLTDVSIMDMNRFEIMMVLRATKIRTISNCFESKSKTLDGFSFGLIGRIEGKLIDGRI